MIGDTEQDAAFAVGTALALILGSITASVLRWGVALQRKTFD